MRRLAIALITYGARPERTEYAIQTIHHLAQNLRLDDGQIGWYIADDGSPEVHYRAVLDALMAEFGTDHLPIIGQHHERMGPGISQNVASARCFDWSDMVLWMEDDWVLREPYNITRHYDLIAEGAHNAGMMRLGYLTSDTRARVVGWDFQHYLMMTREQQYSFSGHPALRHRRWWDAYGPYPPEWSAGQCELDMDGRWRGKEGPEILWPVDGTDGYGHFQHIGYGVKASE